MQLHVYQSMWGMEKLPWQGTEPWSLGEQLDRIVGAGFDGVSVSFTDPARARIVCGHAIERGLRIQAGAYPTSLEDFATVLGTIAAVGQEHVDHINLQPNVRPHTVAACLPYLRGWQQLAEQAGVVAYVETHRDRMTTDLFFTLELLDALPSLRLTADLSHYVVGREFAWPVDEVNHGLIRRVLERSGAYHGRVASREQVQIQISFPHHRQWLELFTGWWTEGFRHFRATAPADAVLTFTTELGPPFWYAITGPDGAELSDRWEEAVSLARIVRDLWASLDGEAAAAPGGGLA